MHPSEQLSRNYPIEVFLFASPVYWPQETQRLATFAQVENAIETAQPGLWVFHRIESEVQAHDAGSSERPCVVIAVSGGTQPWMRQVASSRQHLALFHAYLPECLPAEISGPLMHANAHPASTDFFAACRLEGKRIHWIDSLAGLVAYAHAWQAVQRLRQARLLKIGETEPWVINSCRNPHTIAERIGTEILPLEREELYAVYRETTEEEAREEARAWLARASALQGVDENDILKACRVTAAMRRLLGIHSADGLSMACFAMIGDLDTTSCLALSALNDSANAMGACEGDLDAALTLYLLKALGADFVWIANPIIHGDDTVDLAHCTAPTCACSRDLGFRLMRHHESGRGVSPEVILPGGQVASAVRLSVNAQALCCHVGQTEHRGQTPGLSHTGPPAR